MRLTKRHYFGLFLSLIVGTTILTWPMGLFAFALAQVELGKIIGAKGYSVPNLAQYAHNRDGRYTGEFADLTVAPFARGESLAIARSALIADGFDPASRDLSLLQLEGNVDSYAATWTNGACSMILFVVISSDASDKILVSKISEVATGCL